MYFGNMSNINRATDWLQGHLLLTKQTCTKRRQATVERLTGWHTGSWYAIYGTGTLAWTNERAKHWVSFLHNQRENFVYCHL